jgi:hypothetical protein
MALATSGWCCSMFCTCMDRWTAEHFAKCKPRLHTKQCLCVDACCQQAACGFEESLFTTHTSMCCMVRNSTSSLTSAGASTCSYLPVVLQQTDSRTRCKLQVTPIYGSNNPCTQCITWLTRGASTYCGHTADSHIPCRIQVALWHKPAADTSQLYDSHQWCVHIVRAHCSKPYTMQNSRSPLSSPPIFLCLISGVSTYCAQTAARRTPCKLQTASHAYGNNTASSIALFLTSGVSTYCGHTAVSWMP